MNTVAQCDQSKTRAKHRSWDAEISREPLFRGVVTLDPERTDEAWQRLSVNTAFVEFQEMPMRLHRSLVQALARSLHKRER